jgi:hypothetical protein
VPVSCVWEKMVATQHSFLVGRACPRAGLSVASRYQTNSRPKAVAY